MSIAFAGLMFSSTSVLFEFGSMLFFAVLFDTFIVRTLFLPAVLQIMGETTWWPSNKWIPKPTKGDWEQEREGEGEEEEQQQQRYSFR